MMTMKIKRILKALECCSDIDANCNTCSYFANGDPSINCSGDLKYDALQLIECQQSQIEDLYIALDKHIHRIKELESEVKELEAQVDSQYEQAEADILGNMADGGTSCHWCIDKHRNATIREFAERLTDRAGVYRINDLDSGWQITEEDLESLVKEMTKGTDNV